MAMAYEKKFASARHHASAPWVLLRTFWRRTRQRQTYLDLRSLPEHLQRDIGILDGNLVVRDSLTRRGE
jgi:uncharacterized protein YjiS (DUF1127 family)